MPLIDATYFRGELSIGSKSNPAVLESLQYFIAKYEADCLDRLLGLGFAESFRAGLQMDPVEQRWLDLRDGKIFTWKNRERKWIGFRNDAKISILANYVYYHYQRNLVTQSVGVGEVATKAENARRASPAHKVSRAWNEMGPWILQLQDFLQAHVTVYPEWKKNEQQLCDFSHVNDFNL